MNTNMQPTKNSNVRANCAETTVSNIKTIELKINNVVEAFIFSVEEYI